MPKRLKSSTCSSGWCQNHVFEMNPIQTGLYFRKIQKVRLCPKYNKYTKYIKLGKITILTIHYLSSIKIINIIHHHLYYKTKECFIKKTMTKC